VGFKIEHDKIPRCYKQKIETITKIRYNDRGTPAVITQIGENMKVVFHNQVMAIAPGQAAVFYEGDDVIGGGWIMKSFKKTEDDES